MVEEPASRFARFDFSIDVESGFHRAGELVSPGCALGWCAGYGGRGGGDRRHPACSRPEGWRGDAADSKTSSRTADAAVAPGDDAAIDDAANSDPDTGNRPAQADEVAFSFYRPGQGCGYWEYPLLLTGARGLDITRGDDPARHGSRNGLRGSHSNRLPPGCGSVREAFRNLRAAC